MDFQILYPERRKVSEQTLMGWASDAFENGEIDHHPIDVFDAINMLSDAGIITMKKFG